MGDHHNVWKGWFKWVGLAVLVLFLGGVAGIASYFYQYNQVRTEHATTLKRLQSAKKEVEKAPRDLVKTSDYRSVYTWNLRNIGDLIYVGKKQKGLTPDQIVETFGLANRVETDGARLHLYWNRSVNDEEQDLDFQFVGDGDHYHLEKVTVAEPLQEYRGGDEELEISQLPNKVFKQLKKGDSKTGAGGADLEELLLRYPKPSEMRFKTEREGSLDGSSKEYKSDRLAAYVSYRVGETYQNLLFLRQEDGRFAYVAAEAE